MLFRCNLLNFLYYRQFHYLQIHKSEVLSAVSLVLCQLRISPYVYFSHILFYNTNTIQYAAKKPINTIIRRNLGFDLVPPPPPSTEAMRQAIQLSIRYVNFKREEIKYPIIKINMLIFAH